MAVRSPLLATAVIGAGPAGLLFSLIGRLLHARRGGDPDEWALRLYDKRDAYARTHRLRMDPAPYLEIQRDLEDPRFDALIDFLHHHGFTPEVNLLEERLTTLLADLGVRKSRLTVGDDPGEITLPGLRGVLERDAQIGPETKVTVVAADSVHSVIREWVRGDTRAVRHTHERVARVRIAGPALPRRLGALDQVRLSKVLGSVLDYRLNSNGFAEVDLFLTEREHAMVRSLGATPKDPVPISSSMLCKLAAPLFRAVIEHLERGPGGAPREVLLQSTFQLEHAVMPRAAFDAPGLGGTVFLVGDAAISLPFFRGMAALARCAHSLARAHSDLVAVARRAAVGGDEGAIQSEIHRYFHAPHRPLHFGTRVLLGRIEDVRPTVHHGKEAFVVLHRWLALHGVHVLCRDAAGGLRPAHSLAPVRRRAALAELEAQASPALRYELEVEAIRRREVKIVRMRGRLIRGLREAIRVSSMLPFPVQSWLLSAEDLDRRGDHPSFWLWLNIAAALGAAGVALGGSALAARGHPVAAWLALGALPLEAAGGVVYHAALAFDPGPHRHVRRVWQAQIAGLFIAGAALTGLASSAAGRLTQPIAALWWLLLAGAFVGGLYTFERIVDGWFTRAGLDPVGPRE